MPEAPAASHTLDYRPPAEGPACVHQDESLLVVDKPAGLLSVPGRGAERADCAWSRVLAWAPDAQVVHRLDMSTSGLLLFARGSDMQRRLSLAFMNREVDKSYVAWLEGELKEDRGEVDVALRTDWPRRPRQCVDPVGGKPSRTRWLVVARSGGQTRVQLEPLTGRSHQLRVHMAWLGHPIVGDELYGGDPGAARQAPGRLLLHAEALGLVHPASGQRMAWRQVAPF